jgi:hypothetical protein
MEIENEGEDNIPLDEIVKHDISQKAAGNVDM